jgi:hypothetical protein
MAWTRGVDPGFGWCGGALKGRESEDMETVACASMPASKGPPGCSMSFDNLPSPESHPNHRPHRVPSHPVSTLPRRTSSPLPGHHSWHRLRRACGAGHRPSRRRCPDPPSRPAGGGLAPGLGAPPERRAGGAPAHRDRRLARPLASQRGKRPGPCPPGVGPRDPELATPPGGGVLPGSRRTARRGRVSARPLPRGPFGPDLALSSLLKYWRAPPLGAPGGHSVGGEPEA